MGPTSHTSSAFTVSPIATLPVELLSEIFSICTFSTWDAHAQPGRSEYSPPTITSESVLVPHVLSSVNRRWRAIALSQPSLWSNICVTPELLDWETNGGRDMPPVSQLNTSHITTYISRSKHYALNILIDGRDPDWDFSEPERVLLFDLHFYHINEYYSLVLVSISVLPVSTPSFPLNICTLPYLSSCHILQDGNTSRFLRIHGLRCILPSRSLTRPLPNLALPFFNP